MKTALASVAAIALVVLSACAPVQVRPADAISAAGGGSAATATANGVSIEATTQAWRGEPGNLETVLTPVLVRVTNDSGRPLAISLADVRLVGEDGPTHAAIPVFDVDGSVVTKVRPEWARSNTAGYTSAPNLRSTAPGIDPDTSRLAPERRFNVAFRSGTPRATEVALPTKDMVDRALPEGVLAPGGTIAGFVYFPEIEATGPLALRLDARTADGAEPFATLAIPFVAER